MDSFVPIKEIHSCQERAFWDAEEDEWRMEPVKVDRESRPPRPASILGLPRPTSEFARVNRAMGDVNPRYMYDSIVMTDLDLPERTTEDYEVHPELGDRIERALPPEEEDRKEKEEKKAERGDRGGSRGPGGERP